MRILVIFMLFSFNVFAKELSFNSGTEQVNLLELYTSQSCSSCPSAERWLGELVEHKLLWKKVVPVAYHVTYWNHLSWKDKFSKVQFSKRQRKFSQVTGSGVYTPQVILNGKDFRSWRGIGTNYVVTSRKKVGNLSANLDESKKKWTLTYNSMHKDIGSVKCQFAVLESGHSTVVSSGENRGKTLQENFVITELLSASAKKSGNNFQCEFKNLKPSKFQNKTLAFWVLDSKTFEVFQATGGRYE